MAEQRLLAPRLRTPPPGMPERIITGSLPDDLMDEQIQRFGVFAAAGAGLWTFGLVMTTLILPRTFGTTPTRSSVVIETLGLFVSVSAFLHVRFAHHCARTKSDAGLGYMLLNAIAVAMLNTEGIAHVGMMEHLSWNAIVILLASMIVPTTPVKMFAASLAAASTDPLAVWIAHLRGVEVPSALNTLVLYSSNYVCAVLATVSPHALRKIGHRLREAQELGSYQLVELLGRGGMGEVWRARHRLLARPAAIKLVRPELLGVGSDAEAKTMLRRFEREAQATAALSSPHTIRIFDFGATHDGAFYYVMELLSGRDLESLVREFGPVPADRALYLLRQVCHSLADAHARNLVHRDIKPANIYVCRMGLDYDFVKVLDFGLVKVGSPRSLQQTVTSDHTTSGTPAYMAPEIILGERDVDRRADVYALGCVVYYLLTGAIVFEADTPMKMLLHHIQTPPVPPSQRTELPIPKELDDLVLACLEKNPDRRPQDAEQLFRLAEACRSSAWDRAAAKRWWEMHLQELSGPLTLTDSALETAAPAAIVY
ncbi:MAG TPA: serine/threonine-protein kinase [Vicinamibacterales bacterium]|nr:serine/threonine-protein kinase [Vicinamibacterales bacterium]